MCGIAGIISTQKQTEVINNMISVLNYRGPDDEGVFIHQSHDTCIHLGHVRLSILDLSSNAHQPFVSDCGNYSITYNGEVYNFKSIREKLIQCGYNFRSDSDTEVILYAYKEWGIACLDQFIGMFAFAIYDDIKQQVVIVRDRAGVKPVYYYQKDNTFLFASEIKAFHKHPDFVKNVNYEILGYFMQFGYIPAPFSIFKDCYKLKPGHYLVYDLKSKQTEITEYWNVWNYYNDIKITTNESDLLDSIEELVIDAFQLRLVADVPVGVFLSGGYDSSFVTALLQQNMDQPLNTFTIGFNEKGYNEAEHARQVANFLKTNHTEYYCSKQDMLEFVYDLPHYYDEPFGDSSAIPTMLVSKLARRDVTVALSADGGDEAFCGYSKYFALSKLTSVLHGTFKRSVLNCGFSLFSENFVDTINSLLPKMVRQTNIRDKYQKFKRACRTNSFEEMFINASSYIDQEDISKMLSIPRDYMHGSVYSELSHLKVQNVLDMMMAIDYKTFMVDDVLTKVDRATMSVSLEGREPLLDHRIIELLARIPGAVKYKNSTGKYLLRKVLYKYLPKELVDKPKSGFQVPLYEWLGKDLKGLLDQYLSKQRLADSGIYNIDYIKQLLNQYMSGKYININKLWFVLNFEMWKEKWL